MTPPEGTFVAQVRNGAILIPPPLRQYCESGNWTLFRFDIVDPHHLTMRPVLPDDTQSSFHASLAPDGLLWIPAEVRQSVALGEQSVMLRIEEGAIHVYIRKVFDTLGFRPR